MTTATQIEPFTDADLLARMEEIISAAGSQHKAAKELGVRGQYLSMIMRGERPISSRLGEKMGFEPAGGGGNRRWGTEWVWVRKGER